MTPREALEAAWDAAPYPDQSFDDWLQTAEGKEALAAASPPPTQVKTATRPHIEDPGSYTVAGSPGTWSLDAGVPPWAAAGCPAVTYPTVPASLVEGWRVISLSPQANGCATVKGYNGDESKTWTTEDGGKTWTEEEA